MNGQKRSKTFRTTFKVSCFPIQQFQCPSSLQRNNYSTLPLVLLLVLVNISTSHQFFATSFISCQCLRGYSRKLLHWLLTVSEAPGLPTSVALPAQSMTIQAVLVSARPSAMICSFHEPEQLGLEGGASSSQLQMSGTHCRFTFAPVHQLQSVSIRAQDSSFQAGLSLTFPLRTIEEIELNWTERQDFMF